VVPGESARSRNGAAPRPRVSVVIPAMNEADNLQSFSPCCLRWSTKWCLVDGRSTDATIEVTRLLRTDVVIVAQEGKGKAMHWSPDSRPREARSS